MAELNLNGEGVILLPVVDTHANYLRGFWRWIALLVRRDYQRALEALYWPDGTTWTPDDLERRITTFFGGDTPWSVVIPNNRLIKVVNDASEYQPQNREGWGWFLAQIPLTTEPERAKEDDVLLMGLAVSFFVRSFRGSYVLHFEIFHA